MSTSAGLQGDSSIRVLLVDANPVFLDAVAALLEQDHGMAVVGTVPASEDAVDSVRELQPDAILVDLDMPGQVGVGLVRRLRAVSPGLAIVAMSLLRRDMCRRVCLAAGADGFVPKGALVTDVVYAVRQAAQLRAFLAERRGPAIPEPPQP